MVISKKKLRMAQQTSLLFSLLIGALAFLIVYLYLGDLKKDITPAWYISIPLIPLFFLYFMRKYRRRKKILKTPFPTEWQEILSRKVSYYNSLDQGQKDRFNREVQVFLGEKDISGIDTEVDDTCRLLIAASAVIPVFNFPDWEYDGIMEILVYPHPINDEYDCGKGDSSILGFATVGAGSMAFAKDALYQGFKDTKDKMNVGFHEFIHRVDGQDGMTDGIPDSLITPKIHKEWISIMEKEMKLMEEKKSDINPYGLTNNAEFFAVASEYFFENPAIMSQKHPEMYAIMTKIFKQDTKTMFRKVVKSLFQPYGKKTGRNAPCPCGSGRKYKHCCLNKK